MASYFMDLSLSFRGVSAAAIHHPQHTAVLHQLGGTTSPLAGQHMHTAL